jgi:DNA-binding NtrC family response regulator
LRSQPQIPLDDAIRKVLIVEDETNLRESCTSVLQHQGYDVTAVGRGDEAQNILRRVRFDIVLLDLHMSQVSGIELLQTCLKAHPETLVIIMTGQPEVESSIESTRLGAWDYLPKPFTATHLEVLLGRARHTLLAARAAGGEPASRMEAPARRAPNQKVALLGKSAAFLNVIRLAERVARTDASVFLTGESGSGKEVIAQFIHRHSRRTARPLVAINCAALPETLLESEMFGHCKGAFTGAVRDKPGLLETADGGSFFLDELTEMSQPIQAKLLRVIQDGVVRRVGSEVTDATVDVRFIAAMNRDPREAVDDGILRKDLYYRLSVVPICVPPLRERAEDIPLLVEHFLGVYWRKHRDHGTAPPMFSEAALRDLQARPWPGNVRELQNVIEHAVVLLEPGAEIRPEDIPYLERAGGTGLRMPGALNGWTISLDGEYHSLREQLVAEFEVKYLTNLMDRAGANMSYAAKLAGVDRTTLYRLMDKHGLQRGTIVRAG